MNPKLRQWRASWRDTVILLGEFRTPLLLFSVAMLGGGLLYKWLAAMVGEPVSGYAEAVYTVLTSTFLQPVGNFPHHPLLQLFHFIMPVFGISILAQGLADFGSLLFNRRARNKEWEMAVASTMNKHIVLVGLGHLGYRIATKLHEMGENMVIVEYKAEADAVERMHSLGIPVIPDDATRQSALEAANIKDARAIILASQNDAMNLQIALKARSLNPNIQVVVRIFDEDFAHALQEQFGFNAMSATEMAAPLFAAAAAGADVSSPISVEGQQLSLARMVIKPSSEIADRTVGFVEDTYHLNIVFLRRDHHSHMHPTDSHPVHAGDTLVVLGGPNELNHLMHDNE